MSEQAGQDDGGMPVGNSSADAGQAAAPGPGAVPADSASAAQQRSLLDSEPAHWPLPPEDTGDPGVDAILAGLPELQRQPVAEHTVGYTELHDALLVQLDAGADGD